MSEKSAIFIPLGALNVVLASAPRATRALEPTRLPIGSVVVHASSREMSPAATPVHDWLPVEPQKVTA